MTDDTREAAQTEVPFDRLPNLRNTLERTVPALAAILWSLNVALFCSVSISENSLLASNFHMYLLPFISDFNITVLRHQVIIAMIAFAAGCLLYMAMFYCIIVQLYNFESASSCSAPQDAKDKWKKYTEIQGAQALRCANWALFIMPYALTMFLPDEYASAALYILTIILSWFWSRTRREPLMPKV